MSDAEETERGAKQPREMRMRKNPKTPEARVGKPVSVPLLRGHDQGVVQLELQILPHRDLY